MIKPTLLAKYVFLFLITLLMKTVTAQTGLNFQGVARSSSNIVLASQDISIRLTILQGSATGIAEYAETRKVTTNAQGLFTTVIGDVGALSTVGNFAAINWKLTPKFLKIEMDPAAGANFITMGTTQFQSVAYAQFANSVTAENIVGILPVSSGGTGLSSLTAFKAALNIDKINNSADLDKPLSTASQAALAAKANTSDIAIILADKVDKVSGKELSTNDFSNTEKIKLAAITGTNTGDQDLSLYATSASVALKVNITDITASLATKVDKVSGKDLSTNDFSNTEKSKLAAILGTNTGDQDLSLLATSTSVALKENQSNKSTDALLGGVNASDILFPTQKAVKDYVATVGVADGGITTIKLADLAVTDAKLGTGISKSKVGLGSVENTALSTWTGTNSITIVGTLENLTVTNPIAGSVTGNAVTATTAGNITATSNTTLTTLPNLSTVGTITTGVWSATTIPVVKGGTGLTAAGTAGQILTSTGTGTLTWTGGHYIGEQYGGGIVFYVYDNGKHGLIAATVDQSSGIRWYGGINSNTMARGNGLGAGLKNTAISIATQAGTYSPSYDGNAFAASVCNEYSVTETVGGIATTYGDWYLPSKYELNLLYLRKDVVGGLACCYWSSTEVDNDLVWFQNFFSAGWQNTNHKNVLEAVRAIRAF